MTHFGPDPGVEDQGNQQETNDIYGSDRGEGHQLAGSLGRVRLHVWIDQLGIAPYHWGQPAIKTTFISVVHLIFERFVLSDLNLEH